jgi:hypothetical protein
MSAGNLRRLVDLVDAMLGRMVMMHDNAQQVVYDLLRPGEFFKKWTRVPSRAQPLSLGQPIP